MMRLNNFETDKVQMMRLNNFETDKEEEDIWSLRGKYPSQRHVLCYYYATL